MAPVEPYKIQVSDEAISRLKQKLALADYPAELEEAGWDRGSPLRDVKHLAAYWQDGFDWRKAETKLNELPQFTTDVDVDGFGTLKIHFVHMKSKIEGAIPLLFSHGWPGSFVEVSKIAPELVNGSGDFPAFHVVAPSLVNFGFSEGVKKVRYRLASKSQAAQYQSNLSRCPIFSCYATGCSVASASRGLKGTLG